MAVQRYVLGTGSAHRQPVVEEGAQSACLETTTVGDPAWQRRCGRAADEDETR